MFSTKNIFWLNRIYMKFKIYKFTFWIPPKKNQRRKHLKPSFRNKHKNKTINYSDSVNKFKLCTKQTWIMQTEKKTHHHIRLTLPTSIGNAKTLKRRGPKYISARTRVFIQNFSKSFQGVATCAYALFALLFADFTSPDGSLLMKQTRRLPTIKKSHKTADEKYFADIKRIGICNGKCTYVIPCVFVVRYWFISCCGHAIWILTVGWNPNWDLNDCRFGLCDYVFIWLYPIYNARYHEKYLILSNY